MVKDKEEEFEKYLKKNLSKLVSKTTKEKKEKGSSFVKEEKQLREISKEKREFREGILKKANEQKRFVTKEEFENLQKKNKELSMSANTIRANRQTGIIKTLGSSFTKGKFVGKGKAKIPTYSATNLIKGMARESGALVRDVEDRYSAPVQDNRSLFFKEEFKKEKQKSFGGFL